MDGYGLNKRVLKVFIDRNVLFSRAIIVLFLSSRCFVSSMSQSPLLSLTRVYGSYLAMEP
jgi:hypothetical protein